MDEKKLIMPPIFEPDFPKYPIPPSLLNPRSKVDVGGLRVGFQRTCRVPYNKLNKLPANLGSFPVYKVSKFESKGIHDKVDWDKDDYFMPMYQCEALWLNFDGYSARTKGPYATMIGSGNINAITGKQMEEFKLEYPQNYVVVPPQPWIDGWKDNDGKVYQFVAAELGSGETVEGQITGEETVGGIQISVFKGKEGKNLIPESTPWHFPTSGDWPYPSPPIVWPRWRRRGPLVKYHALSAISDRTESLGSISSMGLGRGGEIKQKIYDDPYGLDVWEEEPLETRTVHIVNSKDFKELTGKSPPITPVTYEQYQRRGYPWFDTWDQELEDVLGSDVFSKLKPVVEK